MHSVMNFVVPITHWHSRVSNTAMRLQIFLFRESFHFHYTDFFYSSRQVLSSNTLHVILFSFFFFFSFSTICKVTLERSPRTKCFVFICVCVCAQHSLVCIALIRKSLVLIPFLCVCVYRKLWET